MTKLENGYIHRSDYMLLVSQGADHPGLRNIGQGAAYAVSSDANQRVAAARRRLDLQPGIPQEDACTGH